MAGKPAARLGDATTSGGPIVQGSTGVLIGSPNGKACSACPGGMAVGNPVNPMLGAKVLSAETDIFMPAPLPFLLSRSYSSYQTGTPAPVGLWGPGFNSGFDASLLITDEELILNDSSGRSIHFELLDAGEIAFSLSESIWLARGGSEHLPEDNPLALLWQGIPKAQRLSPHFYFVTSDPLGVFFVLGYTTPYIFDENAPLPQPLPNRRILVSMVDLYKNQVNYQRETSGEFAGFVTRVIDSAGREFRFELIKRPKRNLPTSTGWGRDAGIRLSQVFLTKDPIYGRIPENPLARYEYNARGELINVFDKANDEKRSFSYHDTLIGRMSSHQYQGLPETHYFYDDKARVVRQENQGRLSFDFIYHEKSTEVIDNLGRKTLYEFKGEKGLKRLVRQVFPDKSEIKNEFDASGRLLAEIDKLGRKTHYQLDVATGRLMAIIAPGERKMRFNYDNFGQATKIIYPDGNFVEMQYDEKARVIAKIDEMGNQTSLFYDDDKSPQATRITDAIGAERAFIWGKTGQLATSIDCSGYKTHYTYHQFGQNIKTASEEKMTIFREYDDKNRLIKIENSAGETVQFEHDEAGNTLKTIFADGSVQENNYTPFGELQAQRYGGLLQHYDYDEAARLTQLTNENGVKMQFHYDEMDRLTQQIGFDGRSRCYHYDISGNLLTLRDENLTQQFEYDELSKLTRRNYSQNEQQLNSEFFVYDDMDRLLLATHQSKDYQVIVNYQRDKFGRISSESQQVKNQDQTLWFYEVSHAYQAQGFRESTMYDGLSPVVWQRYGSGHLLGAIYENESIIEFSRDKLHREKSRQFGNNLLHFDYEKSGRLQSLNLDNHPQFNRHHTYDARGLLTDISLPETGESIHYSYDEAARLIATNQGNFTEFFHYDNAGNRLLNEDSSHILNNKIMQNKDFTFDYDEFGNLIQKTSRNQNEMSTFSYNNANRLTHFSKNQAGKIISANYIYDVFGRRIGKKVEKNNDISITWYGWEGGNLIATEKDNHRVHPLYYPNSFEPLLRFEGENPEKTQTFDAETADFFNALAPSLQKNQLSDKESAWLAKSNLSIELLQAYLPEKPPQKSMQKQLYHCDHLGTPLALFDESGKVIWQAKLNGFGQKIAEDNPRKIYQPIRFQGQHFDEESGLHYNRYRYYDAEIGRYITQDPIGFLGGTNFYNYPTNPIQFIDPLGLKKDKHLRKSCDQLASEINDFINRERDVGGGVKGLVYRFSEQIAGQCGPGSTGWDTHDKAIKEQQKGLQDRLDAWDDNDCGGGGVPIPADAKEWARKPAPTEADWDTANQNNGITAGDVAKGTVAVAGTIGAGYLIYRGIRMIPSLVIPPLWPTIPANAAIP